MTQFSISFLVWLSGLLGIQSYPNGAKSPWRIESTWQKTAEGLYQTTLSANVSDLNCSGHDLNLYFPAVIHGAHEIYIDNTLLSRFGHMDMSRNRSFYGYPIIPCDLLGGKVITWKINSNTKYFARLGKWPEVRTSIGSFAFAESLNIAAMGALLILGIYLVFTTAKTTFWGMSIAVSGIAIFSSLFFLFSVSGILELSFSVLMAHRLADIALLLAGYCFMQYLFLRNLITLSIRNLVFSLMSISAAIFFLAPDGDTIQLGTTLFMVFASIGLSFAIPKQLKVLRAHGNANDLQGFVGLLIFVISSFFDIFYTFGITNIGMTLPFGYVGCSIFLSLYIQANIVRTYEERDYLRFNLEKEVKVKTSQLEMSLTSLRHAQAELVQSAKLVSLGTLAAGLAHEINNSVNYVNGALAPLEKTISKLNDEIPKKKMFDLINIMRTGLNITIEIIKSLRSYTGLNQAKFNDVSVYESAQSVLTILQSKIRGKIETQLLIDPKIRVYGNVVGIGQIFMNLISNAIDAMPSGGKLVLGADIVQSNVSIFVKDTGTGISPSTLQRIFEPFYTTKDVGSGTGLGLYIVKNEVERHRGHIEVQSIEGQGTTFLIKLPISELDILRESA